MNKVLLLKPIENMSPQYVNCDFPESSCPVIICISQH